MGAMASQITSITMVSSIVYSDTNERKHQSSASLAFVWGIHRWPVNSSHKWPVTRKMFPFDDVIMHMVLLQYFRHVPIISSSQFIIVHPYSSGLLHWHWTRDCPIPLNFSWRVWAKLLGTKPPQRITKRTPCAWFSRLTAGLVCNSFKIWRWMHIVHIMHLLVIFNTFCMHCTNARADIS